MTSPANTHVAEIVTFRLKDGVRDADYVALSQTSDPYISGAPGFVSRSLSKAEDGSWTDYTIWDTLDNAKAAQAGFMAQAFAPSMIGAIDRATLHMQHQTVLWQQA